jgi:hypothetical protein
VSTIVGQVPLLRSQCVLNGVESGNLFEEQESVLAGLAVWEVCERSVASILRSDS